MGVPARTTQKEKKRKEEKRREEKRRRERRGGKEGEEEGEKRGTGERTKQNGHEHEGDMCVYGPSLTTINVRERALPPAGSGGTVAEHSARGAPLSGPRVRTQPLNECVVCRRTTHIFYASTRHWTGSAEGGKRVVSGGEVLLWC